MPEREVGCTGRMEVRRSTIRTGKWAHKTMGDERRPVEKGERRKSQDAGQVGTLLKRQPSVGRCSGGGGQVATATADPIAESARAWLCRRCASEGDLEERGCLVGGLRRWEGVEREWSTDGRTVAPKGLGSGPTCMRRTGQKHARSAATERRAARCRTAGGQNLLLLLRWLLAS